MKTLLFPYLLLFLFFACKDTADKSQTLRVDSLPILNDTFAVEYLQHRTLPKSILLDTVKKTSNNGKTYTELVFPKEFESKFPAAFAILTNFVKEEVKYLNGNEPDFTDTTKQRPTKPYESLTITPLALYKTKDKISYSFESALWQDGRMRHFFKYITINFDLNTNTEIRFREYFKLDKKSDSLFWNYIMHKSFGWEKWIYDGRVFLDPNFAFNDSAVYFFYDMFEGPFSPPINVNAGIKKKYFLNMLKQ
ncbi:MAG: hypothetical protein V4722_04000 [Bacteroidota bacterium]